MTGSARAKVEALPDSLVAVAVEQFFQKLFAALPAAEVEKAMAGVPALDSIRAGGDAALERSLSPEDSIELGRATLVGYAGEPDLAPLIAQACDEAIAQVRGKMMIETVLAAGLLVNLTYLVMTTSVHVRRDKSGRLVWSLEKRASPPSFVSSILKKLIPLVGAGG